MINLFLVQNCCTETVLTCPCYVTGMETFSPPNSNCSSRCNRQFQTASTKDKGLPLTLFFLKTGFNTRNFLPILCSFASIHEGLWQVTVLTLCFAQKFITTLCRALKVSPVLFCIPSRAPQPPAPQLSHEGDAGKPLSTKPHISLGLPQPQVTEMI